MKIAYTLGFLFLVVTTEAGDTSHNPAGGADLGIHQSQTSPASVDAAGTIGPTNADDTEKARQVEAMTRIANQFLASGSPNDIDRAVVLLKTASEIEQARETTLKLLAERQQLEQDLESSKLKNWKDFAINMTPFLTTLILAGTLIFQIRQAKVAESEKRKENATKAELAEKARFTNAMEMIQKAENVSPAATLINTFTTPPFRMQARQMAMTLLLRAKTFSQFKDLFTSVMDPVAYVDLPGIVRLLQESKMAYDKIARKAWDSQSSSTKPDMLNAEERSEFDRRSSEMDFLSQKLAPLLKQSRTAEEAPDLRSTYICDVDLTGADLGGANISNTSWDRVILKGCNMSGITEFQDCAFFNSAWWNASSMSKPLVEYLRSNYPYRSNQNSSGPTIGSATEYEQNVARLLAAS